MNMKKKAAPLLAAALVAANVVPVMAEDVPGGSVFTGNYQDVSNAQQEGSTTVVANVQKTDAGNVTYTVSIPSYVDFGSLQRDENTFGQGLEYNLTITGEVTLTDVANLGADQRIAVLVQDTANGTDGFKMTGSTDAALSNKKTLNYKIMTGNEPDKQTLDKDSITVYENGFLVGAFAEKDTSVPLTFSLNQNQITGELDQWAGKYQGTLTFYSKVTDSVEYN